MKSYYLTNRAKYIYFAVSLMAIITFVGFFLYLIPVLCFRIYFLGLGLFGIYSTLKRMPSEHIVVSENGIEYHTPWLNVESKWASIEKSLSIGITASDTNAYLSIILKLV